MRELIKAYSYVAGTRTITVDDSRSFTEDDIRLIVNETKKIVITSSMNKDNIISVIDKSITYSDTVQTISVGDKLTIEIDFALPNAKVFDADVQEGKNQISNALNAVGQPTLPTDSLFQMSQRIYNITGDVIVRPISGYSSEHHDLADVLASYPDVELQGMMGILLPNNSPDFVISGFSKYRLSDGNIYDSNLSTVSFDVTKDGYGASVAGIFEGQVEGMTSDVTIVADTVGSIGNVRLNASGNSGKTINQLIQEFNCESKTIKLIISAGNGEQIPTAFIQLLGGVLGNEGKTTRWLIGYTTAGNAPAVSFGSNINTIIGVLFHRIRSDNTILTSRRLSYLNWSEVGDYVTTLQPSQFQGNLMQTLYFPNSLNNSLFINGYSFYGCSALSSLIFPSGLQNLTISGGYSFYGCSALSSLIFPSGLQNLTISGTGVLSGCSALSSLILPSGLQNLNVSGANNMTTMNDLSYIYIGNPSSSFYWSITVSQSTRLTKIELENKWNWSISLVPAGSQAQLTATNAKNFVLDRLADKRGDGFNISTASMNTTSPIVAFTNGNCLEIFRAGDTITLVGGAVRTIATVDNANQVTLTTNGSHDLTNVAYNINKTLTLSSVLKTDLQAVYGANWAKNATDKGWTIA